jgi:hypothetical protein
MVHPVGGGFSDDDVEEEAEAMEVEVLADHQHHHHHQQQHAGDVAEAEEEEEEASTDAEEEQAVVAEAVVAAAAVEDTDDDDDDDDEDLVMASVVDDDDDADEVSSEPEVPSPPPPPPVVVVAAAAPVAVAVAAARKTPGPKRKRKPPASATKTPTSTSSASAAAAAAAASSSSPKKKAKPRKKPNPSSSSSSHAGKSSSHKKGGGGSQQAAAKKAAAPPPPPPPRLPSYAKAYAKLPPIPSDRLQVSSGALKMLQEHVPVLPMSVGEVHVRSLGRLALPTAAALARGGSGAAGGASSSTSGNTSAMAAAGGGGGGAVLDSSAQQQQQPPQQPAPFATRTALYPVGYSCDRHEYSPVHGRFLKMRCSILDGRQIRQALQAKFGGGGGVMTVKDDVKPFVQDGPVFRVMWGRGVDEETMDDNVLYPFNPKIHAAPIDASGKINESSSSYGDSSFSSASCAPTPGMRVKVRFDKNESHYGTITQATAVPAKKKSRKTEYSITILYEDESTEVATYPDPDIMLAMPGTLLKTSLVFPRLRFFFILYASRCLSL